MVPSLEVPGNQMGPRGTAPNDKSLKSFISGAAPRNPMALRLETPWRRASKPCAAPRNPMAPRLETPGAPRLKTPGDKF